MSISNQQRTYRNSPIGTTEGTFQGKRYFTCQDGCGLFLPLHLMHPTEEVPSQNKIIPSECTESPRSDRKSRPTYAHAATKGNSSQPSHIDKESAVDPAPPLFINGERVTFYNNKGVKHYGVVGWTGRETKTRKFPYVIVGITTVSICCDTVNNKRRGWKIVHIVNFSIQGVLCAMNSSRLSHSDLVL